MIIATGVIGAKLPEIVFADSFSSNVDTGTYSATKSFGAEHPSRVMILIARTDNANLQSGYPNVSIGGVTATQVAQNAPVGFTNFTGWVAAVPTGTSGNVTVSRGGNGFIAGAYLLWAAYHLRSATPVDWQQNYGSDPVTQTVAVQASGLAVSFAHVTSDTSITWSGLTEDYDSSALAITNATLSGASAEKLPANAAYAVTSDAANNTGHYRLTMSFR